MRRTTLSDDQRAALQEARHDPSLHPHERDCVEMIVLSASGWSSPRIAAHLGCSAKRVRAVLDRYPTEGVAAIRRRRPGPPPDTARRTQVTTALQTLLAQARTWTARQLAEALGEQAIRLSPRQTRRYLQGIRAHWQRTQRSLRHKQDAQRVATATHTLGALKRGRRQAGSRSPSSTSVASAPASR
jgi:transposase